MKRFGIITFIFYKLFYFLKFLPPQVFLEERVKYQIRIADLPEEDKQKEIVKRNYKAEAIVFAYLVIYLIATFFNQNIHNITWLKVTFVVVIILRLIDIIQTNVNVSVFDSTRIVKGIKGDNKLHSLERAIVFVSYSFIEVAIIFALLYSFMNDGKLISAEPITLSDYYYFSFITQLTIGFGDITPVGIAKFVTVLQGIIGYFFTILIISRLLSSLPKIDSRFK